MSGVEVGQRYRLRATERTFEVLFVGDQKVFLRCVAGGLVGYELADTFENLFKCYALVPPPVFEGVVELVEVEFMTGNRYWAPPSHTDLHRRTGRTVKVREVTE